jgi:hypothetical protein
MSSTANDDAAARSAKLAKRFILTLNGKQSVDSLASAKLFLEAVCNQKDTAFCIEKLVNSPQAMQCLRTSLRVDTSPTFINDATAPFLLYLSNPTLKIMSGGQLVRQILLVVVEPPMVWNALCLAFNNKALTLTGIHSFAWLLYELLSSKEEMPLDVTDVAHAATAKRAFLDSTSRDIRMLGSKIQHTLQMRSVSGQYANCDHAPGGRHDNDFPDFRKIAIYPTADEFTCTEQPFYRRAGAIDDAEPEQRVGMHLDNQFRLLREDMLSELRNDLQPAMRQSGRKTGRPSTATVLRDLELDSIDCGSEQRRKPCALVFRCRLGIPQLQNMSTARRLAFLGDHKNFMRHQSFGCLLTNASDVVAFVTFQREDKLLADNPPRVVVQVAGEMPFQKVLAELKLSGKLQLVLVNTSIFAYEPVLRCLQQKAELPLSEEILSLSSSQMIRNSAVCPHDIVQIIRQSEGGDLKSTLKMAKSVRLDKAQSDSLVAALTQTLSLIQGPPGNMLPFWPYP